MPDTPNGMSRLHGGPRLLAGLLPALVVTVALGGCMSTGATCGGGRLTAEQAAYYEPLPVSPDGCQPGCAPTPLGARGCPVTERGSELGEIYVGASVVAGPAWGPSIQAGQVFRRNTLANWSFELDAAWQELDNEILGGGATGGEFAQLRGSVKAELNPCGRGHPTIRAGFGWFRTTGETDWVDGAEDYIAFHLGIGYEFDVARHFTTGPEITALFAAAEKGFDVEVVPQARWHFIWKF